MPPSPRTYLIPLSLAFPSCFPSPEPAAAAAFAASAAARRRRPRRTSSLTPRQPRPSEGAPNPFAATEGKRSGNEAHERNEMR